MDERVTQYFLGQLNKEDRIRLLKERETNPQLKKDFITIQNLYGITYLSHTEVNLKEEERKYIQLQSKQLKKKVWLIGKHIIGYAAVIIISFLIGKQTLTTTEENIIQETSIAQLELYVPSGQRARITLPDGSMAWLNAGSTLHYPSVFEKERRVRLEGEGFFDVAKDAEKPFIVSTRNIDIKALGTQFNVYSYSKAKTMATTLTEGSVLIYPTGKEESGQILEPNQRLIVENGKFTLEKSIDWDELLWKEGIYSFKKERMEDIAKKLELYFDVEITINNPRILNYRYTGKFRQRDGVLEILRIIQKIHHFKITANEDISKITLS